MKDKLGGRRFWLCACTSLAACVLLRGAKPIVLFGPGVGLATGDRCKRFWLADALAGAA